MSIELTIILLVLGSLLVSFLLYIRPRLAVRNDDLEKLYEPAQFLNSLSVFT